jgi:hypothetical protein
MDGLEHKRASKTEWGYFVGMQWPMCLVYKPEANKVISVSRKKLVCHEGMYAQFDPTKNPVPKATIQTLDTTREINELKRHLERIMTPQHEGDESEVQGVHSVKVLRDANLNQSLNEDLPPPPINPSQLENQGENCYEPEKFLNEDSLLEKINELKRKAKDNGESQYQKIVEAVKNTIAENLKLNFPNEEKYGADINTKKILQKRSNLKEAKRKAEFQIGKRSKLKQSILESNIQSDVPNTQKEKWSHLKGRKRELCMKEAKKYMRHTCHVSKKSMMRKSQGLGM